MGQAISPAEMDRITANLETKSDKIRQLASAGAAKGDIARYLGIRYQFVYNVLKGGGPKQRPNGSATAAPPEARALPMDQGEGEGPLTIPEAKRRLARTLGVDVSSIKITIEG